jgi:hypothetical protein
MSKDPWFAVWSFTLAGLSLMIKPRVHIGRRPPSRFQALLTLSARGTSALSYEHASRLALIVNPCRTELEEE